MKTFTVTIDEIEEKALLVGMVSIQDWLTNLVHSEARRAIDVLAGQEVARMQRTPSGPAISADKRELVRQSTADTAAQRQTRIMEESIGTKSQ